MHQMLFYALYLARMLIKAWEQVSFPLSHSKKSLPFLYSSQSSTMVLYFCLFLALLICSGLLVPQQVEVLGMSGGSSLDHPEFKVETPGHNNAQRWQTKARVAPRFSSLDLNKKNKRSVRRRSDPIHNRT